MTPKARQAERSGPLKGHYKQGRKFVPPLLNRPETVVGDWTRSDLPDLLWPASLYKLFGSDGIIRFVEFQRDVLRILEEHGQPKTLLSLDGRLSSLEAFPVSLRAELVGDLRAALRYRELDHEDIVHALLHYEGAPGSWLLGDPTVSLPEDEDRSLGQLGQALATAMTDRHAEALIKFLHISWQIRQGSFHSDQQTIDLLRDYPCDPDTVSLADTAIRAIFNAQAAHFDSIHPDRLELRTEWARRFWQLGWQLSPCLLSEALDIEDEDEDKSLQGGREQATPEVLRYAEEASEHFNRFMDDYFEAPLDLERPARSEVIAGLVSRTARVLVAVLRTPHLWSGEHSAHVLRTLAETEITLSWLAAQGSEDVYETYQAYGHGKAKLARRHMQALLDSFPNSGPKLLRDSIEQLESRSGGTWGEEFTVVDLGSTFSGKSLREMAAEVKLEELYRHVYQQSSAIAHGEWWTLKDYSVQRCGNPLHRFHYLPSMEPVGGNASELPGAMLGLFSGIVNKAVQSLCTENLQPESRGGA